MAESLIQKVWKGNFSAQTLLSSQLAYQKSLENLSVIISELNKISNEDGDLGINTIRHLVLSIHLPFSSENLQLVKTLRQNDKSEKIDFLSFHDYLCFAARRR